MPQKSFYRILTMKIPHRIDVAFDKRLKVRKYKLNLIFLNFNGILRHINWPGKAVVQPTKPWLGYNIDLLLVLQKKKKKKKNIDLLLSYIISFIIWCFWESAIKGNHYLLRYHSREDP